MKKSSYIPNDNFEVSVFISMTEFCHKKSIKVGFMNLNQWGLYYQKQIQDEGNVKAMSKELLELYVILGRMHALTVPEITTFIIIYFKYKIWLDYEPLLNARKSYTGSYY